MCHTEGKTQVISPAKPREANESAAEEGKITILVSSQDDRSSQTTPCPTPPTMECSRENTVLSPLSETSVASYSPAVSVATDQNLEVPIAVGSTDGEPKSTSETLSDDTMETEDAVEPSEVVPQATEDSVGEPPETVSEGHAEVCKDSIGPSDEANAPEAAELPKTDRKPDLTLNISSPNSEEEGVATGNQTQPIHPLIFPG